MIMQVNPAETSPVVTLAGSRRVWKVDGQWMEHANICLVSLYFLPKKKTNKQKHKTFIYIA